MTPETTPDRSATPGQTVGPFFGYALPFERGEQLVPLGRADSIRLHGTVYDGNSDPIPDAILELWQADSDGAIPSERGSFLRDGYTFTGWGRAPVDNVGQFSFTTVEPGVVQDRHARFFSLVVFARGLLDKLHTRIYLPEDTDAHAVDPLLCSLSTDERRTLIATREPNGSLRFDVRLQGEGETVFLDYWGT